MDALVKRKDKIIEEKDQRLEEYRGHTTTIKKDAADYES